MIAALAVFFAALACDLCWAKYVTAAAAGRRWVAAAWGVGIYLAAAVPIVEYTANHWLLVPAVAGAFLGTALGVKEKRS